MKSIRLIGAVVLMSAVSVATAASPTDWPGWRGPNRDGKSIDTGLLKSWPANGPKQLWKIGDLGKGFSSPVVVGGMVYVTGDVGKDLMLFMIDADGKLKGKAEVGPAWTKDYPGSRSTPTIDADRAYVVTGGGMIVCLSTKDGKRIWTRTMQEFGGDVPGWGYAESVLIDGDKAIVTPGGKHCIVALDKKTGKTIWTSSGFEGGAHYGSCISATYKTIPMIIAGTGGGLVAVNPADGKMLWSNPFCARNTANCPTPVYEDGYVFWANGYGKGGVCMKLSVDGGKLTATQAWTTRDMVCHVGGYIINDGYVYGNNGNGWACIDLKTGKAAWKGDGVGKGSLCYADGMLYLFSEAGGKAGLATCSPEGLKMEGTFSVAGSAQSWAHPIVVGGKFYLRYDANLYCFDVKQK